MSERKKTKIVATLGPSTDSPQTIKKMILEGVDVFRINFSHADHSEVENRIKIIREISDKLQSNTSILADLQGPKLRIGRVEEGISVEQGDLITFQNGETFLGDTKKVFMNYKNFSKDVTVSYTHLTLPTNREV